jgi:hypothetical protein
MEFMTGTLTRQGEIMDSAYRAATQMIEQIWRLSEAKSPNEYVRLVAGLWRKALDAAKTQSEAQLEELRRASRFRWHDGCDGTGRTVCVRALRGANLARRIRPNGSGREAAHDGDRQRACIGSRYAASLSEPSNASSRSKST